MANRYNVLDANAERAIYVNADRNGLIDATAAFSAAFDAAQEDYPVFIPPGDYLVESAISKSFFPRMFARKGTVRIRTTLASHLFTFLGSIGAQVALSSDVTRNTAVITVASTAGISVGDLLLIGDDVAVYSGEATRTRGQLVMVGSVDSATQLTLVENVYSAITAASGGAIQKVSPISGGVVDGIEFENTNSANAGAFIWAEYAKDVYIDVACRKNGSAAVALKNVYGFEAKVKDYDAYDNQGASQFGYGLSCARATAHGIAEVQMRGGRHAFVALGDDNARGEPYDIVVRGRAHGCTSAAWDVHAQGQAITLEGVHSIGCKGYGAQIRSKECHIKNATIINCAGGIWLFDNPGYNEIKGNTIRTTRNMDGGAVQGPGILLGVAATGIKIDTNTIEKTGRDGIKANAAQTDLVIKGQIFGDVGEENVAGNKNCISLAAGGTRNTIHGNDWREGANGLNFLAASGSFTDCREWGNNIPSGKVRVAGAGFRHGQSISTNGQPTDVITTVTFSATLTIDTSLSRKQQVTLTNNITSLTLSNGVAGQELILTLIQDATGSRTVAWPSNVKFAGSAPTLSGASKRDMITLAFDGTNWYEKARSLNMG